MPNIYTYFHVIKFGVSYTTTNPSDGTLRLGCNRDEYTHGNIPFTLSATSTHGLGNSGYKYTDYYDMRFDFSGFPGTFGTNLNGNEYYIKVVSASEVDVYNDAAGTSIVDPSTWGTYTQGGLCVIDPGQAVAYQLIYAQLRDSSNTRYYRYDSDYYSGAGNEVNSDFGANIIGAKPQYYVVSGSELTGSVATNKPIDYDTVGYNSDFNPTLTITCEDDGGVYDGTNGQITGVSLNMQFCGLMQLGSTYSFPYQYGGECLVLPCNYDSDTGFDWNFNISDITQGSPAVVTFSGNVPSQTSSEVKTITGVSGMTEINGKKLYVKSTSHNTADLYTDSSLTTPFDTSAYTAYTSGGNLQTYDANTFGSVALYSYDFDGRDYNDTTNFGPFAVDYDRAGSIDQYWPTVVKPAKVDWQIIHPVRKSYAQDLTRYTNSLSVYGYKITLTYNNISSANWKVYDGFIKQMRGSSAPFLLYVNSSNMGYDVFTSNSATVSAWSSIRLAKAASPGDTMLYFQNFAPNTTFATPNDVFYGIGQYSSLYSYSNFGFSGGTFGSNEFGEGIMRITSPIRGDSLSALSTSVSPASAIGLIHVQMSADTIDYDWHPTGNFVSFKVELDVI